MKRLVMLTLVVAGVLSISACEDEVITPSNDEFVQVDNGTDDGEGGEIIKHFPDQEK